MGIMDKIKKATGADDGYEEAYETDSYYDDLYGGYNDDNIGISGQDTVTNDSFARPNTYADGGISLGASGGSAVELKVVKPEHFESVPQIADHLLQRRTVVLNLENTNKETARRLIDFLSGVAYSIDGSLKKIASNAYVITPSNVEVGDANLKASVKSSEVKEEAESDERSFGNIN